MREDYTHICIVLDRSGSMDLILTDTIGGYNTFLNSQKAAPGFATITLRMFANTALPPTYDFMSIRNAPELSLGSYTPSGMTALYDAVGQAIRDTGERLSSMPWEQRPGRVLFVILTDGKENNSKEYTYAQIAEMIKVQAKVYKWEFVFLGANQDAMKTADSLNIARGQTMTFAANSVGTVSVFHSLADKVRSYRSGELHSPTFDSDDRAAQTNAGVDASLNAVRRDDATGS
jgi:Mg-chelatase subunit ChlD